MFCVRDVCIVLEDMDFEMCVLYMDLSTCMDMCHCMCVG